MYLSVLIPFYNEDDLIEQNILKIINYLTSKFEFEILIINDSGKTNPVLEKLNNKFECISLYNNKKVRFNELKKVLKTITQQMLSKQLKELETDGIVNRKVHQVVPPKVEYSLTEFGLSVIPILKSFSDWNRKNTRTISLKLNKNFEENRIR